MEEEKDIIPKKQEEPKVKNNGLIIVLLLIIILALAGYIVYDKVLKKDNVQNTPVEEKENKENKEESKEENNKEEKTENKETETKEENKTSETISKFDLNNLAGKTFKTKDGKKVLKIVSKTDSEAVKKAKEYGIYDVSYEHDYLGYYNNKFFVLYKYGESAKNPAGYKYVVLGGVKEGHYPQCRDTHEFVINTVDNTLVDLDYDGGGNTVIVHKVGEKYYFSQGGCALTFMPEVVYDENTKVIGQEYYGNDSKNNIYVRNNGKITKYDASGKVVKQNSTVYDQDSLGYTQVILGDTIYMLLLENDKIYLLDGMTNEKYEIGSKDDMYFSSFSEDYGIEITKKGNDVFIKVPNKNHPDVIEKSYTFSPTTKKIVKN